MTGELGPAADLCESGSESDLVGSSLPDPSPGGPQNLKQWFCWARASLMCEGIVRYMPGNARAATRKVREGRE